MIFRALGIIPKDLYKPGVAVILLLIFATILDLFSLAVFLPVISLLLNPEKELNFLPSFLDALDRPSLARWLTGCALLLLLVKTFFNAWVTREKAKFAYNIGQRLAESSLSHYLKAPYKVFSGVDFAGEMNRISNVPLTFANNFVIPMGTLFAEGIVGGTLFLAAFVYEPKTFLILVVTIAPLAVFYGLHRSRIKKSSLEVKDSYPLLLKHALQAIEAITEIRVFKKENYFLKQFAISFSRVSKVFANDHVVHTSTGRLTELAAGACICVMIIFLTFSTASASEVMLTLSVYAAISFRMVPSINRVSSAFMQMKTHEHILGELQHSEKSFIQDKSESLPFNFHEKIEFIDLSFHYGNNSILNKTSFTINANERVLLHGKSGSGKTTLLLLMLGFHKPSSGFIRIDGKKFPETEVESLHRMMAYVPQNPYILDGSIAQNIAFGIESSQWDLSKINTLIQQLDLEAWVSSLPDGIHSSIGENGNKISGGQRQRIAIARALYHDAQVLLMDEITNHLDKNTELEVMNVLNGPLMKTKTIVLVTHRPEIWKSFDTMYELKNSKLHSVVLSEAL